MYPLAYPQEATNGLTRDELANQVKRFANEFDIRILHQTTVAATQYNNENGRWMLKLLCENAERTLSCKHLVLATGAGYQEAYMPEIPGIEHYVGINIHSTDYKNARQLAKRGAKVSLAMYFSPSPLSHCV